MVLLSWLLTNSHWLLGLSMPTPELTPPTKANGESAIGLKAPLEAMVDTPTSVSVELAMAAKSRLDLQLISTELAASEPPVPPWAKGELTGASAPLEPMRNMATESEIGRATPKNLPLGDTLMPSGASPTKKGEPVIAVSAPFDPTLNAEM